MTKTPLHKLTRQSVDAFLIQDGNTGTVSIDSVRDFLYRHLPDPATGEYHGMDDEDHVFFYEHDFYVLSNFSAFNLVWKGLTFPTSEHAYHWCKFTDESHDEIRDAILYAPSAHEAFKVAARFKEFRRNDWDEVKRGVMKDILRIKVLQHEYVRRKLLATDERILIEDSWRDSEWGWGPNKDGKNMLGELWMEVRAELRSGKWGSLSFRVHNQTADAQG